MDIRIESFQSEFRLYSEQELAAPIESVFMYFSDARNLEELTPDHLQFKITTPGDIKMAQDTIIEYKLRVRGVPIGWTTLISAWEPPFRFVDEQIRGPYRYWIHEHRFEARGEKTLVKDLVRYQVVGGGVVHQLFVKPDLEKIFTFRSLELEKRFNSIA